MKSLGVCYWYFKIWQRGYTEHELEYIMFYVQKYIWRSVLVSRSFAANR